MLDKLFQRFENYLAVQGFTAKLGHIVDASLVEAPKQRNSRSENAEIKEGQSPSSWEKKPAKKRQKDWEARWVIKPGKTYYGYKTHIHIDVKQNLFMLMLIKSRLKSRQLIQAIKLNSTRC